MNCGVIKDLLPLYIEKLTSEASNELIEEHIKNCEDCRKTLSKLKADIVVDNKEEEFKKIENMPDTLVKRIRKNIYEKILMAVSITFILGIMIGIFSAKMFMFMAFLGSISIIIFTVAVLVSIPICCKKSSLEKRFKVLGNWVFVLSLVLSGLIFLLFRGFFYETGKIIIILGLEIAYNIILSLTLRIYAALKLPKADTVEAEDLTNKKLFIVTFTTLIFMIVIITVPVTVLEKNRIVDNIDLNFVNDSNVIGKWTAVDFVSSPEKFNPDKQLWTGRIFLKEMTFLENGQMKEKIDNKEEQQNTDLPSPWLRWTKGYVINEGGDHTANKYDIREINGSLYMFLEWKSGDYAYFHRHPSYYVLKKEANRQ